MNKISLLTLLLAFSVLSSIAQTDLRSTATDSKAVYAPGYSAESVELCNYIQVPDSMENGRLSETGTCGTSAMADDIVVTANQCGTIHTVSFNQFIATTAVPIQADITFFSSTAVPSPDTIIASYTSVPFTYSYVGTRYGYNVYEVSCTLPTPLTLCADTLDTHFWLSCQLDDGSGASTYWEFQTGIMYNSTTAYSASSLAGPWNALPFESYVFSINLTPSMVEQHMDCDSVVFSGNTYTADTTIVDTFISSIGCDSLIFHEIMISNIFEVRNFSGCDSLQVDGNMYYASTAFTDVYTASTGCDSTVETHITITGGSQIATINLFEDCDSVLYGGTMYTTSFAIYDTLAGATCDSIVVDSVVVHLSKTVNRNVTVPAGGSVTVGSNTYTTAGTYVDTLTTNAGCDSVVTTVLSIEVDGIMEAKGGISVFPNPTQHGITVTGTQLIATVRIIDIKGTIVHTQKVNGTKTYIALTDAPAGIYFCEITSTNGEIVHSKVIKR